MKKYTLEQITKLWKRYNSPLIVITTEDNKVPFDDFIQLEKKGDFIHFIIQNGEKV